MAGFPVCLDFAVTGAQSAIVSYRDVCSNGSARAYMGVSILSQLHHMQLPCLTLRLLTSCIGDGVLVVLEIEYAVKERSQAKV